MTLKTFCNLLLLPVLLSLGGCGMVVLHPSGVVAGHQRDIFVISVVLMLLIIVPVIALTALFAWKFRHSNRDSAYDPDWHHSTRLELVIWSAPLIIVIALGSITWVGTHLYDPYRPLNSVHADGRPIAKDEKPLVIDVVAMNWKWLFIYPDQKIAAVNEVAAPVDRQIQFNITSSDIMNSFYIPALAGQIYAMAGMQTKLHAAINVPGVYDGFSANYSGAGFSDMTFKFHGMKQDDFHKWVRKVKGAKTGALDLAAYGKLDRPSTRVPVTYYPSVDAQLYDRVLNECVDPSQTCIKDRRSADAGGEGQTHGSDGTHDQTTGGGTKAGGGAAHGASAPVGE